MSQKMLRNLIQFSIVVFALTFALDCFGQKDINSIKKVVIDAGHGGKDPGATVGKTYEKDIALDVALKTGRIIRKMYPDVEVLYTRDKDVFPTLDDRPELANKKKADLFISIHVNICATPSVSGAEVFILGRRRSADNFEVAKLENSVILLEDDYSTRYEGFDPTSPESYIMFEMLQNEFLEQSRMFADMVQHNFVNHAKRKDRGVKQDGFLVLRKNAMPSILVELGFLSNKEEREFMEKDHGRTLLAESIVRAFGQYKTRYEGKSVVEKKQHEENKISDDKKIAEEKIAEVKQDSLVVNVESLNEIALLKGKWYGTQIMSIDKKLPPSNSIFKNQKPLYFTVEKGMYKYFIGLSQNSDEAYKSFQNVKSQFKGAFLVSFTDGVKGSFK
jgi:N-acetylmuramoyl-L-alanine amidase